MPAAIADSGQPRVVLPFSGRLESLLISIAGIVLVAGTVAYAVLRPKQEGPPPLFSWQVSSFDGLNAVDQAVHSALLPASQEIVWFNVDTGGWPSIDELEENLMPPFYKDAFWKKNGEIHWQRVMPGSTSVEQPAAPPAANPQDPNAPTTDNTSAVYKGTLGQGAASYYGSGGKVPGQSAFLVVIGHAHTGVFWTNQATLWIHSNPNAPFPDVVKADALVAKGWRQIIPYSGTSEVERVKGKNNGR